MLAAIRARASACHGAAGAALEHLSQEASSGGGEGSNVLDGMMAVGREGVHNVACLRTDEPEGRLKSKMFTNTIRAHL